MSLSPINDAGTAASPIDGFGTIFEYSPDGTTWNQVANLVDIKPGGTKFGKVNTTTHSTPNRKKTSRPGLGESDETELVLLYDATAYSTLKAIEGSIVHCRVTFTDTATDAQLGWLSDIKIVTPQEADATIECKFQLSGDDTFTAPA